jgi:homoserine dehydrogenase
MLRILGFGNVGKRLGELAEKTRVPVCAVADSSGVLTDYHALLAPSQARSVVKRAIALKSKGKKLGLVGASPDFSPLWSTKIGNGIIADCSATDSGDLLLKCLSEGNAVVLANKKALTGSSDVFSDITAHPKARWEATVGAGLPVICTAKRMLKSGDVVKQVQGQLSGTLGFLLSSLDDPNNSFSASVRKAEELGYTEPDPRDDLGGVDVARKALILTRYALGMPWVNLDDIRVEPLFPVEFASLSIADFRRRLPELDDMWKKRVASAKTRGCVVRYAATCTKDSMSVGLVEAPLGSPLAGLQGTKNLVSFESEFYPKGRETVVSGPGAGIDVTASAVLADVIEIIESVNLNEPVKWAQESVKVF